ncbi:BNR repeat-containing protein [Paenibacillus sp. TRM 82003]|nr:BNR repeat-containing protein [Paenibacillus sp. TRM 82003]
MAREGKLPNTWNGLHEVNGANNGDHFSSYVITKEANTAAFYGTSGPGAVYDPISDKTFISYSGPVGDPYMQYFDHKEKHISTAYKVGTNVLPTADNHGIPAMEIDSDGFIHVIFGGHGQPLQYARSVRPRDITEWTATKNITEMPTGTYPHVTSIGTIVYFFYRAGEYHSLEEYPNHAYGLLGKITYSGASTTIAPVKGQYGIVVDVSGKYPEPQEPCDAYVMDCDAKDGKLHLLWCSTQGAGHGGLRENIYHAIYDPSDNKVKNIKGTVSLEVADWANQASFLAYEKLEVNLPKQYFGKNGEIFVVFTEAIGASVGICVLKWNGKTWTRYDTSARTQSYNHYQHLRIAENGMIEGFFITSSDNKIENSNFRNIGGDLTAWESKDGTEWRFREVVCDRGETALQGIGRSTSPKNAHRGLKILYVPFSLDNLQRKVPIMGATNEDFSTTLAVRQLSKVRSPYLIRTSKVNVLNTAAPATSYTPFEYRDGNGVPLIPPNTTELLLLVTFKGNGVSGVNTVMFREHMAAEDREMDDVVTFFGQFTTDQMYTIRCSLTEGTLRTAYKVSGTGFANLKVDIIGFFTN